MKLVLSEDPTDQEILVRINGKEYVKRLAKITGTNLGFEDHGMFTFMIQLDFEGSSQGFGGYVLESQGNPTEFGCACIMGILKAVNVENWESLRRKIVYAIYDSPFKYNDFIRGIQGVNINQSNYFILPELAKQYYPEESKN